MAARGSPWLGSASPEKAEVRHAHSPAQLLPGSPSTQRPVPACPAQTHFLSITSDHEIQFHPVILLITSEDHGTVAGLVVLPLVLPLWGRVASSCVHALPLGMRVCVFPGFKATRDNCFVVHCPAQGRRGHLSSPHLLPFLHSCTLSVMLPYLHVTYSLRSRLMFLCAVG